MSEGIVLVHALGLQMHALTQVLCTVQVPVIAKADSMTLEELRQFRKYVRSELEQVLPVS